MINNLIMKEIISEIGQLFPLQLAFHTKRQSKDYFLDTDPVIACVGDSLSLERELELFNFIINGI